MKRQDFSYKLPEQLIAQYPIKNREESRLLCLDKNTGLYEDRKFIDLPELIQANDLLVFNDTRVIPARLFGHKQSGGKVEILVERLLDEHRLLAQLRASKSLKSGSAIQLQDGPCIRVEERQGDFYLLTLSGDQTIGEVLNRMGHVPLPPYIHRQDEVMDKDRYQTVYARHLGAVAAPTAGLHFSESMLEVLQSMSIATGFVTLHVGAGTFQPIRASRIEDHVMHKERFTISKELCEQIRETRQRGGRVIAVGTTTVRCLESAVHDGEPVPAEGETDIFIYPGFTFQVVDVLITNFHLPESTLLVLVCAFAGREKVLRAYRHAVAEQYRFFSYGDAMFIS